jgi:hypothetical protein
MPIRYLTFGNSLLIRAPKLCSFVRRRTLPHREEIRKEERNTSSSLFLSSVHAGTRTPVGIKLGHGNEMWGCSCRATAHVPMRYPDLLEGHSISSPGARSNSAPWSTHNRFGLTLVRSAHNLLLGVGAHEEPCSNDRVRLPQNLLNKTTKCVYLPIFRVGHRLPRSLNFGSRLYDHSPV